MESCNSTEAASLGVLGAVVLAVYFKSFTFWCNEKCFIKYYKTSIMISFIIVGAWILSKVVGFLGIARAINWIYRNIRLKSYDANFNFGNNVYFFRMILDGISIVIMTLPIVLPIILMAGFDPLWFGIFLVFMVELSQITPTCRLLIVCNTKYKWRKKIEYILKATLPFFFINDCGCCFLITFSRNRTILTKIYDCKIILDF